MPITTVMNEVRTSSSAAPAAAAPVAARQDVIDMLHDRILASENPMRPEWAMSDLLEELDAGTIAEDISKLVDATPVAETLDVAIAIIRGEVQMHLDEHEAHMNRITRRNRAYDAARRAGTPSRPALDVIDEWAKDNGLLDAA